MMKTKAPVITSKGGGRWVYPAVGTRIAIAWETAWRILSKVPADEYLDGPVLAALVAERNDLHVDTIKNLLNSALKAGLLEREYRRVDVPGRGPRTRSHYRIKVDA
jgi:hypothetical protein